MYPDPQTTSGSETYQPQKSAAKAGADKAASAFADDFAQDAARAAMPDLDASTPIHLVIDADQQQSAQAAAAQTQASTAAKEASSTTTAPGQVSAASASSVTSKKHPRNATSEHHHDIHDGITSIDAPEEGVSNKIFTVPNIISFCRLLLIPVFLVLLFNSKGSVAMNILATLVFAIAAGTDFLDGHVARSTNQVSKLGQVLDPTVDRLLMLSGTIALIIVGRLPLWIVILIVLRDLTLLVGGGYLMKRWKVRVPVIYVGKVCTTLLYVGLVGLLINWPLVPGLGIVSVTWLPGFNAASCSWGIWFIYAGLVIGVFTTAYYITKGMIGMGEAKAREALSK